MSFPETVTLTCSVSGVRPSVDLHWTIEEESHMILRKQTQSTVLDDGLYNVTTTISLDATSMAICSDTAINCEATGTSTYLFSPSRVVILKGLHVTIYGAGAVIKFFQELKILLFTSRLGKVVCASKISLCGHLGMNSVPLLKLLFFMVVVVVGVVAVMVVVVMVVVNEQRTDLLLNFFQCVYCRGPLTFGQSESLCTLYGVGLFP